MSFYQLSKEERVQLCAEIKANILLDIKNDETNFTLDYFSDQDTYIRKTAYESVGKIFKDSPILLKSIIGQLAILVKEENPHIRQTAINAAGEIGKTDFESVQTFFDTGLFDEHHTVRNAVIGSIKKMGEKNPSPVLAWAKKYLDHPDKEIRREICHGIELRGRTNPEDILPLLKHLQWDKTARVRNTLVHVLGQISYKKGCLETVIKDLQDWENTDLVKDALEEIIDVHERYKDFAYMTQAECKKYIQANFTK